MKFRKKPIVVDAERWFNNGDHSGDGPVENEGLVVRRFRRPVQLLAGDRSCEHCGKEMKQHGWIDTLEDGHVVCPGDWIITGVEGEKYPCKPSVFDATYEMVGHA